MAENKKMKLGISAILFLVFLILGSFGVRAQEAEPVCVFELTIDGKEIKEAEPGDIITVTLRLKRTDSAEAYMMYAMQDEIRYDGSFFELIEGSVTVGEGIQFTDISLTDHNRELYMNYLSVNGGTEWQADTLVGSFQLKVIGEHGVATVTNQDSLVSKKDGSGSYASSAEDVLVIVSTECVVSFQTNGGSEIADQTVLFGEKIVRPQDPTRAGYCFAGWYKDIHLSEEWNFDTDTVAENMSLYAKWIQEEQGSVNEPDAEESPSTSTEGSGASVGDSGMLWCWLVLAAVCAAVLVFIFYGKKTKNSEKARCS